MVVFIQKHKPKNGTKGTRCKSSFSEIIRRWQTPSSFNDGSVNDGSVNDGSVNGILRLCYTTVDSKLQQFRDIRICEKCIYDPTL
jgi:hypothetical protein